MGAVGGSTSEKSSAGMRSLVVDLARPYRGWLVVILLAMMVETAASLAGPWPLKIVIDNAVGRHAAPAWVVRLLGPALAAHQPSLAAAAAIGMVLLAVLGGVASYIDNYYTERVGWWVRADLRMRCAPTNGSFSCLRHAPDRLVPAR
jgi:subfamily B ATP-binding cassette protein MsbA